MASQKKYRKTSNGRLPLKHASVHPQTLSKRFSHDSPHFMFRPKTFIFGCVFRFLFQSRNYRKIENCLCWRSWEFLDTTGVSAMKNDPQWTDFQVSTTFGRGVQIDITIFSRLKKKVRGRKMKCGESCEKRFDKVWGWTDLCLRGKRPFEVLQFLFCSPHPTICCLANVPST